MNIVKKLRENLSETELIYANEFLKHGNKLDAYQSAFPNDTNPSKSAYMFHKRVSVDSYIKESQKMASEKAILDKAWVLNRLKQNSDLGTNGWETENGLKRDLSSSNRASELIGKDLGMFTNEITINGISEVVKELKDKADDIAAQMASEDDEKE